MLLPTPETLFAPLAARLPPLPAWLLPALGGVGLVGGAAAVALHQPLAGAGLLLAGLVAAGLGQAAQVLSLGVLAPPFGFGLADPSRALAAMFLITALAVVTVVRRGEVSIVYWLAGAGFVAACILPNWFSPLAYLIGVICFAVAGQGAVAR